MTFAMKPIVVKIYKELHINIVLSTTPTPM